MKVFVTGATGFIGSAIVKELIDAGHQVLGLARSDGGANALLAGGAEVHRGELEDLDSLRLGASLSDAVIHAGFNHDFSKFATNCEVDRRAIEVLGDGLSGTARPLIVTAGIPYAPDRVTTEDNVPLLGAGSSPRLSEETARALASRGVNAIVVRVSQVHDRHRHGLASFMIALAREKGFSAYVDSGLNRWPAVHRLDAARVYARALEHGKVGAAYQAVDEDGVALREIAESIGRGLGIPAVSLSRAAAAAHFGWLSFPVAMDAPASSTLTQQRLDWRPTERVSFIENLNRSSAFDVVEH
ncbi:MAG: SDR family oxidoreductase [Gemmatimonadaceae bacterium]|nr:SDR family oxidoreductase [Gemmatimonadaceae bacterium]